MLSRRLRRRRVRRCRLRASFATQANALARKNVAFQRRKWGANLCLLSAPFLICAMLYALQEIINGQLNTNSFRCGCKCLSCCDWVPVRGVPAARPLPCPCTPCGAGRHRRPAAAAPLSCRPHRDHLPAGVLQRHGGAPLLPVCLVQPAQRNRVRVPVQHRGPGRLLRGQAAAPVAGAAAGAQGCVPRPQVPRLPARRDPRPCGRPRGRPHALHGTGPRGGGAAHGCDVGSRALHHRRRRAGLSQSAGAGLRPALVHRKSDHRHRSGLCGRGGVADARAVRVWAGHGCA